MKINELNLVEEHLNSNNSPFRFNAKELDCLSREAVRFGKETGNYYYGARYYDPKFSIWISVDPLAEMYPATSSYAYVANNPINYIDPDGNRIIISKDGKNYFYERGKLYDTGGNLYKGSDDFLNATRDALWRLDLAGTHYSEVSKGVLKRHSLIHKLVEEDNIYMIKYTKKKNVFGASKTGGNGMDVNHKSHKLRNKIRTEKGLIKLTYEVGLAHELGHLYSNNHRFSKSATWFEMIDYKGNPREISLDELFAIMFENTFRDYLGIPRRTHYNELPESEAVDPRPYERAHIYNGIRNQVPNEPQQKPAPKPKGGSTAPDKKTYLSPRYF